MGAASVEQSLCGNSWRVRDAAGREWAAHVPGCAHTDLMRAGVMAHPDSVGGEAAQEWVGRTEFTWLREFSVDEAVRAHAHIDLVFERLDTEATVSLDGEQVLACANEFHPQRVEVTRQARGADNGREFALAVTCEGSVAEVERLERELGRRPVNGDWTPYPFLRKTACEFGWDWGPRVPSSGIRGLVYLHGWTHARVNAVRPLVTSCDATRGTVEVVIDAAMDAGADVEVRCELTAPDGRKIQARGRLKAADSSRPGFAEARVTLEVPKPMLWWPRGHGGQPLYRLDVALQCAGEVIDRATRSIGVRTAELDTRPDRDGTAFVVKVNGAAIWCAGANWIPDGLFDEVGDPTRVRERLVQACEANLNMIRVWGGGGYEQEHFYSACDELGLLVWQDFAFACATYPEDDPFPARVDAEARFQVARLSSHPSVVLWCGGNEDILAWASWGFRERLREGQSWGRRYWLELLPRICSELDPTRPYWPESPWSGSLELHPNDPTRGDRHTWDQEAKVEGLRTITPRFCSEFGHQSPPALATLSQALAMDESALGALTASEGLALIASRQRATGGDSPQYSFVAERYPPARDFATWIAQAQLVQAKAMRIAYTWMRANAPRCMGALVWQLNDAWTGHSWSLIDVRGRAKPAWHAVRDACQPRILAIHPREGALVVDAVNDTESPWRSRLRLARSPLDDTGDGGGARCDEVSFEIAPRSSGRVCAVPAQLVPDFTTVLRVEAATGLVRDPLASAWHCVAHEVDWRTAGGTNFEPRGSLEWMSESSSAAAASVRVSATTHLLDAIIVPRGPWRSVHPMLVSLAPGESVEIAVEWEGRRSGVDLVCAGRCIASLR